MDPEELKHMAVIHKSIREQVDFDKAFPQAIGFEEEVNLVCGASHPAFYIVP